MRELLVGRAPRPKEADTLKLPALPDPVNFKGWRSTIRAEVVAVSGRGEEVFPWIMEVESRPRPLHRVVVGGHNVILGSPLH